MKALVAVEAFKLRKRPMAWILLVFGPLLVVLVYLMLLAISVASRAAVDARSAAEFRAALDFRNVAAFADGLVFRTSAIAAIILAGVSTSSEYRWRTAAMSAARTGERGRTMGARLTVYAAFAILSVALGFAAAALSSWAINAPRGTLDTSEIAGLAPSVLVAAAGDWLLVMVYIALATAIAAWSRSAACAVGLPLVTLLLEPLGASLLGAANGPIAAIAHFTLSQNIDAVLAANGAMKGSPISTPEGLPSAWQGALFLLTFAAMSALAAIAATRRDLQD